MLVLVNYIDKTSNVVLDQAWYGIKIHVEDSLNDKSKVQYSIYLNTPSFSNKLSNKVATLYQQVLDAETKLGVFKISENNTSETNAESNSETEKVTLADIKHLLQFIYYSLKHGFLYDLLEKFNTVYKGTTEINNLQFLLYSKEEVMLQILNNDTNLLNLYTTVYKRSYREIQAIERMRNHSILLNKICNNSRLFNKLIHFIIKLNTAN
jgi:hypothetical protein